MYLNNQWFKYIVTLHSTETTLPSKVLTMVSIFQAPGHLNMDELNLLSPSSDEE